jgi:hypothetical protein
MQAVPPNRRKRGQPVRRPRRVYAARVYDYDIYRDKVRRLEITPSYRPRRHRTRLWSRGPLLGRRGRDHDAALFRRLRIRWEIRDDIHQASSPSALHLLATTLQCLTL